MKSSSSEPGPRQNVQKMFRHVLPHYGSTVVTASKTVTDHFYPQFALILLKIHHFLWSRINKCFGCFYQLFAL